MNSFKGILQSHFHLPGFRQGQPEIISAVLSKKDVIAVLPTGGGKSLCYQFPAVFTQQLVIVVSPLIALMKDQVTALDRLGIPAGAIYSGQPEGEKRTVFSKINQGGPFVLYLSPERVQKEGFQNWIRHRSIALFAIDEAHCVSQWGHDFRAEYGQLDILKTLRPDVPTLALTASATPTVLSDISKQLKLRTPEQRVHGFYRPNLYFQVEFCKDEEQKNIMLLQGLKQTPTGRVLIYCGTRRATQELAMALEKKFDGVGFYHAGLSPETRTQTQQAYVNGDLRILVATNAFGMGIDQADVRLVVHYHMPATIDSLYQEMGRAGRDGKNSTCIMLYSPKDKGLQSYFIQNSEAPRDIKNSRWRNLDALVNYSEGSECRHAEILTYYRDSQRLRNCGHCDSCDPKSSRRIVASDVPTSSVLNKLFNGSKPKSKLRRKPSESAAELELNETQDLRFQLLRQWRRQKSLDLDTPAFTVFSDRTLKHLALANPQNPEQLKTIYGIGDEKIKCYGNEVLSILVES
jgi:ATP-dependent DNA helicase RecQ